MSDVDPNEEKTCPECRNTAELKEWVFVEEDLDRGMIFQCPHCKEKMSTSSME